MLENRSLDNLGIQVLDKLENKEKVNIIHEVSQGIVDTFPNCGLEYEQIFNKLFNTDMYRAIFPDGITTVNYYYRNSSIYFDVDCDTDEINEFILHECIHKIQERKDKKDKIVSIGLCGFDEFGLKRMAFNEGAIQYMVVNILKNDYEKVKLYDIELKTKSRKYFPLITNLVTQIIFLEGRKEFEKNIFINPLNFVYYTIDTFGELRFKAICDNLDYILKLKEKFVRLSKQELSLDNQTMLESIELEIKNTFFETQEIIMKSYFDSYLDRIETLSEVDNYRKKIFLYRNYIGKTKVYDKYYLEQISKLKVIEDKIKRRTMLIAVKNNFFVKIIGKIKSLLGLTSKYEQK